MGPNPYGAETCPDGYVESYLDYLESAEICPLGTDWYTYIGRKIAWTDATIQNLRFFGEQKDGKVKDIVLSQADIYQARLEAIKQRWSLA